jgi:hypothetical protein
MPNCPQPTTAWSSTCDTASTGGRPHRFGVLSRRVQRARLSARSSGLWYLGLRATATSGRLVAGGRPKLGPRLLRSIRIGQLAQIVADLSALRQAAGTAAQPYDVVAALPPDSDPAPYAAAGATWWLVEFPAQGATAALVRAVIRDGPAVRS